MKFPFVKQKMYFLFGVHHESSFWGCLKWWLLKRNRHCFSFCLNCPYYYRCQEDVAFEDYRNYR